MTKYYYTFKLSDPDKSYHSVAVAGSFNGWNYVQNVLKYDDASQIWTTKVTLDKPHFEYKYVTNGGTWILDEDAPIGFDSHGNRNNTGTAISSDPEMDTIEHDIQHVMGDIRDVKGKEARQAKKEITGEDEEEHFETDLTKTAGQYKSVNDETRNEMKKEVDETVNPGLAEDEKDINHVISDYNTVNSETRAHLMQDTLTTVTPAKKYAAQEKKELKEITHVANDIEAVDRKDQKNVQKEFQREQSAIHQADENDLADAQNLASRYAKDDRVTHANLEREFRDPSDVSIEQVDKEVTHVMKDIGSVKGKEAKHTKKDFQHEQSAADYHKKHAAQKETNDIQDAENVAKVFKKDDVKTHAKLAREFGPVKITPRQESHDINHVIQDIRTVEKYQEKSTKKEFQREQSAIDYHKKHLDEEDSNDIKDAEAIVKEYKTDQKKVHADLSAEFKPVEVTSNQEDHDINHVLADIRTVQKEGEKHTKKDFQREQSAYNRRKAAKEEADLIEDATNVAAHYRNDKEKTRAELHKDFKEPPDPGMTTINKEVKHVMDDITHFKKEEADHTKKDFQIEQATGNYGAINSPNEDDLKDIEVLASQIKTSNTQSKKELKKDFQERDDVGIKQISHEINHVVNDIESVRNRQAKHAAKDFKQEQTAAYLQQKEAKDRNRGEGTSNEADNTVENTKNDLSLLWRLITSFKWFINYYILSIFHH